MHLQIHVFLNIIVKDILWPLALVTWGMANASSPIAKPVPQHLLYQKLPPAIHNKPCWCLHSKEALQLLDPGPLKLP